MARNGSISALFLGMMILGCGNDGRHVAPVSTVTGVFELVDTLGYGGESIAFAFDASGAPHMAYGDISHQELKHTYHDGSEWVTETVTTGENQGRKQVSLTFDQAGSVHIAYHQKIEHLSAELRHARKDAGGWFVETVDGDGFVATDCSITCDKEDNLHIAYRVGYPDYNLRYARNEGGVWNTEVVDPEKSTGGGASIAMDEQGMPIIAYGALGARELRYARWSGGNWTLETVSKQELAGVSAGVRSQ